MLTLSEALRQVATESQRAVDAALAEDLEALKQSALAARLAAEEQEQVDVKKKDYRPSVIAKAAHTYEENRYLVHENANDLLPGLSWDLFDGGARGASVRQADLAAQGTRRELLESRRTVEIQVEQAHRDFQQALRESATAQTNVAAAEENLRIIEDQYQEGWPRPPTCWTPSWCWPRAASRRCWPWSSAATWWARSTPGYSCSPGPCSTSTHCGYSSPST